MDLEVRDLDEDVARALSARAARRGISVEEEARRTLIASVEAQRQEYLRRLQAFKAAAASMRRGEAAAGQDAGA